MARILKIKRLRESAKLPRYAYAGDAGLDLFSCETLTMKNGERAGIKTGIAVEISKGHVGLVWDKSSVGARDGLKTLGGVIDHGYRGEVIVGMVNLSGKTYRIEQGQKIAQMVIQKFESVNVKETNTLSDSHRATRAFGSSGRK